MMEDVKVNATGSDFRPAHAAMQLPIGRRGSRYPPPELSRRRYPSDALRLSFLFTKCVPRPRLPVRRHDNTRIAAHVG
jgi:hypothetical protein